MREELDYEREARHARLYRDALAGIAEVRVPSVRAELSTRRLLTLDWLEGAKILNFTAAEPAIRNRLAVAMFKAWWHPFSHVAVIHGDPHLGNYTVFSEGGEARGINLLDYGCIRIFPPSFVGGVVDLYRGLLHDDFERIVHAYEVWGFKRLSRELIDILNIWARFIYGPLLEDRVRTIADGVKPSEYGRRQAFQVHKALKEKGPVIVPREFVFMDRAAIGLGGVFLHLKAELNFHRLFESEIERFSLEELARAAGAGAWRRRGSQNPPEPACAASLPPQTACAKARAAPPSGGKTGMDDGGHQVRAAYGLQARHGRSCARSDLHQLRALYGRGGGLRALLRRGARGRGRQARLAVGDLRRDPGAYRGGHRLVRAVDLVAGACGGVRPSSLDAGLLLGATRGCVRRKCDPIPSARPRGA